MSTRPASLSFQPAPSRPLGLLFVLSSVLYLSLGARAGTAQTYEISHTIENPTPETGDAFGHAAIALGDNLIVAAPGEDTGAEDAGAVYLIEGREGRVIGTLRNPDPAAGDRFGHALAAVGERFIVGVPGDDTGAGDTGIVYVFDGSSARLLLTLENPTPASRDQFGTAVAALDDDILVGAPLDDTGARDAGAVYLFDGETGRLLQTFQKPSPRVSDQFGASVATLKDRLLVGAPGDDTGFSNAGAAYLLDGGTGRLLQTFQKPTPAFNDQFGSSVAFLSNNVLVGAPRDDTGARDAGAVYLFDRNNGQLLRTFQKPSPGSSDQLGLVPPLAVGDHILIGVPNDDTGAFNAGAAYLFNGETGALLHTFENPKPDLRDQFSSSIAALGQRILIGASFGETDTRDAGVAYLFQTEKNQPPVAGAQSVVTHEETPVEITLRGSDPEKQTPTFAIVAQPANGNLSGTPPNVTYTPDVGFTGEDSFTFQVNDGELDSEAATVAIAVLPAGVFELITDEDAGLIVDVSVALSGDLALVGAKRLGGLGAAYVFARQGGTWTQQAKLTAADADPLSDSFGSSVAFSGDFALIGAHLDIDRGSSAGAAYVFMRQGGTWTQQAKLTASDGDGLEQFGSSVALSGDLALIGAHIKDDDQGREGVGAAYIFVRQSNIWTEQAKLTASDGEEEDAFGFSVALSGDLALIGAARAAGKVDNSGAAYVFARQGGTWTQQAKLTAIDGEEEDRFGISVAFSGDLALIGAHLDDNQAQNAGAAYVFVRQGGTWTQQTKLTAADGEEEDRFGVSVAFSGGLALVGAERGSDAAAAYVFARQGDTWTQQTRLTGVEEGTHSSVAFSGNFALVGARTNDNQVAAYIFEKALHPTISLPQVQIFKGGKISVPLLLNLPPGLVAATVKLSYDQTRVSVEADDIHTTELTKDFTLIADVQQSSGKVGIGLANVTPLPSGTSSALALIPFEVENSNAISAGDMIDLVFDEATLVFDKGGLETVEPVRVNGRLEIVDVSPGDVDQDGVLALSDVVLILRALVQWPGLSPLQRVLADVNQDGQVTLADALEVINGLVRVKQPLQAPSTEPVTLTIPPVQATPGQPVSIPIALDRAYQVRAVELYLRYDETALRLTGITPTASGSAMVSETPAPGLIHLAGVSHSGLTTPEGYLAELAFHPLKAGTYPVSLEQVLLLGADGSALPFQLPNAAPALPQAFALLPNFPNPFNPETTIRYALPTSARVDIAVYNLAGQRVETLMQQHQQAGYQQVTWRAADYTSGVYLLLIEADNRRETMKMLLLK